MEELTKKYYRIADVSALLGIPPTTLRFWETKFSDLRPKRNNGSQRLYTPNDIKLIQLIAFLLKDRGLKIEAAQDYIHNNRNDLDHRRQVIETLLQIRQRLETLLQATKTRH